MAPIPWDTDAIIAAGDVDNAQQQWVTTGRAHMLIIINAWQQGAECVDLLDADCR